MMVLLQIDGVRSDGLRTQTTLPQSWPLQSNRRTAALCSTSQVPSGTWDAAGAARRAARAAAVTERADMIRMRDLLERGTTRKRSIPAAACQRRPRHERAG